MPLPLLVDTWLLLPDYRLTFITGWIVIYPTLPTLRLDCPIWCGPVVVLPNLQHCYPHIPHYSCRWNRWNALRIVVVRVVVHLPYAACPFQTLPYLIRCVDRYFTPRRCHHFSSHLPALPSPYVVRLHFPLTCAFTDTRVCPLPTDIYPTVRFVIRFWPGPLPSILCILH